MSTYYRPASKTAIAAYIDACRSDAVVRVLEALLPDAPNEDVAQGFRNVLRVLNVFAAELDDRYFSVTVKRAKKGTDLEVVSITRTETEHL